MSTIIVSDTALPAPRAGGRYAPGRAMYRAAFGLGDSTTLIGVQTAAGDGLTVGTWQGDDKGLAVSNGSVVRGSNTGAGFNGLATSGSGASMTMLIRKLPTAGSFYFDVARQKVTGAPDSVRLSFFSTGSILISQRIGGVSTNLTAGYVIKAGDLVTLRFVGGIAIAEVNKQIVLSAPSDVATNSAEQYAGLAWTAPTTGFEVDNLEIDVYP